MELLVNTPKSTSIIKRVFKYNAFKEWGMPKKKQSALPILLLILILSVGLKYHFLDNFNIDRRSDEGVYVTLAVKISENLFDYTTADTDIASWGQFYKRPLFAHPPMYPFLLSIVLRTFGTDITKLASINIISNTITLIFIFLIARELYDRKVALLASGFFAFDPLALILSGRLLIDGILMMWITSSFYFFIVGHKNKKNYYISGALFGAALLSKASAYPMVLVYLIMLRFKPERVHINAFLISLLVFSPWLLWNIKLGLNPFSFSFYGSGPDLETAFTKGVYSQWYTSLLGLVAVNPVFLLSFFAFGYKAIKDGLGSLEYWALVYVLVFSFLIKIKLLYYFGVIVPPLIILASWYILELEKKVAKRVPKEHAHFFKNHIALFVLFAIIAWYNYGTSQELSKIYLVQGARLLVMGNIGQGIL